MRWGIRRKIMLFTVGPVLLACMGIFIYTAVEGRRQAVAHTRRIMDETAWRFANQISAQIREATQVAESTMDSLEVQQELAEDELYDMLRRNVQQSPIIYGAAIAFMPGQFTPQRRLFAPYVHRSAEGLKSLDIGEDAYDYTAPEWEWWHATLAAGGPVWTKPYFDMGAGNVAMSTYAIPFRRGGAIAGVTTIDFALGALQATVLKQMSPGVEFFVLAEDGQYLLSSHAAREKNRFMGQETAGNLKDAVEALRLAVVSGNAGWRETPDWRGQNRTLWVFYAPIEGTGWSLAVTVDKASIMAGPNRQLLTTLGIMLSLVLLMGMVASRMAKRLTVPLGALRASAIRMAEGQWDTTVPPDSGDEVGELAMAFSSMALQLRGMVDSLEERFRRLVDQTGGVVYRCENDEAWSVHFMSDAVEALSGYPAAEFMQGRMRFADFVHPDDLPALERAVNEALEKNSWYAHEYRLVHKEGHSVWVFDKGAAVHAPDGTIVCLTGIVMDVTSSKMLQLALRESEEQLRTLVENIPGVVFRGRLDSGCTMLYLSEAIETLTGYPPSDFIGNQVRSYASIVHPDDVGRLGQVIETARLQKEEYSVGYRIIRADGEERWVGEKGNVSEAPGEGGLVLDGVISDVTARRSSEEQTKRYEFIANSVRDMMSFVSTDYVYEAVNNAWCAAVGKSREQSVGASISTVWGKETFEQRIKPKLDRCFQNEIVEEVDEVVINGKTSHLEMCYFPYRGANEITHAVIVTRDVTEKLEAQEVIRKRERDIRLMMDASPVAKVIHDDEGRIVYTNQKFTELFGYTAHDIPTVESWWDIAYPDVAYREEVMGRWAGHVAVLTEGVGGKGTVDAEVRCKNGEMREIEATSVRIAEQHLVIFHDLTDRNRVEREVRESKEFLRSVIDNSSAYIHAKDMEGRYILMNRKWEEMLGYDCARAIGKSDAEIFPADTALQFQENDRRVRDAAGPLIEEETVLVNGQPRIFRSIRFPVREADGRPRATCGMSTDITDMKQIQVQLEQARHAAEQANRAKSDFLASMSHEIRTPMNAVIGLSHLALRTDLNPKQQDYLKKIQTSANALLNIINDILDFSKIEAGMLRVETIPFDLEEILDGMAGIMASRVKDPGKLEMYFSIAPDVPRNLLGDPLRIGQILINLCGNAVKFTEAGEILVSTRRISGDDDNVTLEFSVSDTGIGLNEEEISRLFQPFVQADGSTTRRFGGTGLGLSISRRLVDLMGGSIGVRSSPGKGSTFYFILPFGLVKSPPVPKLLPNPDLRGLKILVVDDNATARRILNEMLQSQGFDVFLAESGEQALKLLATGRETLPIDLILMDWSMPGMTGTEAARRIRRDLGLKIPVILVSAYGRENIEEDIADAGIDSYLLKPLNQSLLFDAMISVMRQDAKESNPQKKFVVTPPTSALAGVRVLVADDNEINRQVALELLTGSGLEVTLAQNGAETIELAQSQPFDAVLMDIQMPVMDGLEATRVLRHMPQFAALPIIAMTANAMAGDRERCLEAGMNDYVSKPIDPDQLFATLCRWTGRENSDAAPCLPPSAKDEFQEAVFELEGVDVSQGLWRTGGKVEVYKDLLQRFRARHEQTASEMRAALAAPDEALALRLAHSLKGTAGNMGADDVAQAAKQLEHAIRENSVTGAGPAMDILGLELARVLQAIARMPRQVPVTEESLAGSPVDADALLVSLREFNGLLDTDLMAARQRLAELRAPLLQTPAGDLFHELESLLGNFDTDGASACVLSMHRMLSLTAEE